MMRTTVQVNKKLLKVIQKRNMSFLNADSGIMGTKVHHLTNILLLGLAPVAFLGHPSVSFPVDCILGTVIPIHAHIGLNSVISDYVPKALRTISRIGVLGLTLTALIGLAQLNFEGPGVTASIKALWKSPKPKEQA